MTFPSARILDSIQKDNLDVLCELDARGLFAAPGENFDDYRQRLFQQGTDYRQLVRDAQNGKNLSDVAGLPSGSGTPVSREILQEAAAITENLYGFSISWVPAYFLSRGLGLLWGGCTILTEQGLSLFVIRKSFAHKKHWFLYDRDELLAHELCHVARNVFENCELEEHFAYTTAKSALRRYTGNCFRSERDALLFLLPVLLLLLVEFAVCFGVLQIPFWPFVILALVYPVYLLIRNQQARNLYFRVRKKIENTGCKKPDALLFRCSMEEIRTIDRIPQQDLLQWIHDQTQKEIRWQVINKRFMQ